MKKIFNLLIFCLLVITVFTPMTANMVSALETGGTDYVVYDPGTPPFPDQSNESRAGSLKSVLGGYDLHSDIVGGQLTNFCNAGQRKISLLLHFVPHDESWNMSPAQQSLTYNFGLLPTVLSLHGVPTTRLQNNVRDIVTMIANLKNNESSPCFNELQFRFAPFAAAHPGGWKSWNETHYQENKAFIWTIRDIVKSAAANTPLTIYFDLGAEQAGLEVGSGADPYGQNNAYLKKLWQDYTGQFGTNDTYGFSIALALGRFTKLMSVYDSINVRPGQHAIDIYDEKESGMESQLANLFTEMQQAEETGKPVVIQETYFDDQVAFDQIIVAQNNLGINIRTIMQWQMSRGHFDTWIIYPKYRYFGASDPAPPPNTYPGDLNGDGKVDIFDFNLLVANFGNPYTIFDFNNIVANFRK